jgi:hypothetical protein
MLSRKNISLLLNTKPLNRSSFELPDEHFLLSTQDKTCNSIEGLDQAHLDILISSLLERWQASPFCRESNIIPFKGIRFKYLPPGYIIAPHNKKHQLLELANSLKPLDHPLLEQKTELGFSLTIMKKNEELNSLSPGALANFITCVNALWPNLPDFNNTGKFFSYNFQVEKTATILINESRKLTVFKRIYGNSIIIASHIANAARIAYIIKNNHEEFNTTNIRAGRIQSMTHKDATAFYSLGYK